MDKKTYDSVLVQALFTKNVWIIVALISVATNMMLAAWLVVHESYEKQILLPPVMDKPFTSQGAKYSASYIEQMSTWFTSLVLTYTPDTYEYQAGVFLKYTDPVAFGMLKANHSKELKFIKNKAISSSFFIKSVTVKGNTAAILGIQKKWIGTQLFFDDKKAYVMNFSFSSTGSIMLRHFKESTYENPFKPIPDTQ